MKGTGKEAGKGYGRVIHSGLLIRSADKPPYDFYIFGDGVFFNSLYFFFTVKLYEEYLSYTVLIIISLLCRSIS